MTSEQTWVWQFWICSFFPWSNSIFGHFLSYLGPCTLYLGCIIAGSRGVTPIRLDWPLVRGPVRLRGPEKPHDSKDQWNPEPLRERVCVWATYQDTFWPGAPPSVLRHWLEVAPRQISPLLSVFRFPWPCSSQPLFDIISPPSFWFSLRALCVSHLPLCASDSPSIVFHTCYIISCPFPFQFGYFFYDIIYFCFFSYF